MNRNYKTAQQLGMSHDDAFRWGDERNTHPAVVIAIHAIASGDRTPEQIWENPTSAEAEHVEMAVQEYVIQGDYAAGEYRWGEHRFNVSDE